MLVAVGRNRRARHVLHHEIRLPSFGGARVVNMSDIRMLHQSESLALALEADDCLRRGDPRLDKFKSDLPLNRVLLLRQVNDAHSALAQNLEETIAINALAGMSGNARPAQCGERLRILNGRLGSRQPEPQQALRTLPSFINLSSTPGTLRTHFDHLNAEIRNLISSSTSAGSTKVSPIFCRSNSRYLFRTRCTATFTAPSLVFHCCASCAYGTSPVPVSSGASFSKSSSRPSSTYSWRKLAITCSSSASAHCLS